METGVSPWNFCAVMQVFCASDAGDKDEQQGEEKNKEDESKPEATDKADGN